MDDDFEYSDAGYSDGGGEESEDDLNDSMMDGERGSPAGGENEEQVEILTKTTLFAERQHLMEEVAPLVDLPAAACHPLLSHYKWNKEVVMEKFLEPSTSDEQALINKLTLVGKMGPRRRGECAICCDEGVVVRGLSACGHRFCATCWDAYLREKITGPCQSSIIHCPGAKCARIVSECDVESLVIDAVAKEAYRKRLLNDFVRCSSLLKWCPAVDCEHAARLMSGTAGETESRVKCDCKHSWCFACGEEWHEPADCATFKAWTGRCVGDSETYNWINAYTKDCPNTGCKSAIEKNGGCNYMRCMRCSKEFCWMCLADWATHKDHYSCNRYKEGETPSVDDKAQQSRESLRRYLHYFERYKNHQKSRQFETKLNKAVSKKENLMKNSHSYSYVETNFLPKAVSTLLECRRTLAYTYAFAFYLSQASNHTVIFENNQEDLESATEKLSALLEHDLEFDKEQAQQGDATGKQVAKRAAFEEYKLKVINQTNYVESRRRILLEHCREGREKDEWVYTEGVEVKRGK